LRKEFTMSKPAVPVGSPVHVFAVVAPGADPASVLLVPHLIKLGWKFGDVPLGDLIDQVRMVDDHLKALEKWVEGARGVLKQKLPVPAQAGEETVTPGRLFEAHYSKSTRTDIDRDKVKTYFGAEYPNYCKTSEILTLKITPIVQTPGTTG